MSKAGSEVLNLKSSESKKRLTTTAATTKRQGITDVLGRGFRFQNLGLIFIVEICDRIKQSQMWDWSLREKTGINHIMVKEIIYMNSVF